MKEFKPGNKVLLVVEGTIEGRLTKGDGPYVIKCGEYLHTVPRYTPMIPDTEVNRNTLRLIGMLLPI